MYHNEGGPLAYGLYRLQGRHLETVLKTNDRFDILKHLCDEGITSFHSLQSNSIKRLGTNPDLLGLPMHHVSYFSKNGIAVEYI